MSPKGPLKPREPGSLKEAEGDLVHACGGQREAAALTRVRPSQMQRYTDDSDENATTHMPVDIVAVLEAHCGAPIVTRRLAAAQGYALLDARHAAPAEPAHEVLARLALGSGKLLADSMRALHRDRFDPKKSPRVVREALAQMQALSALVDALPSHAGAAEGTP